jgi:nucleoid-associated protein YgaU
MSVRRLTLTTAAMALIGVLLAALTPEFSAMTSALAHAQRTSDTDGADALVMSAGGLLAWGVWGWGAAGLGLTALSALPGVMGAAARLVLHVVLPAGARRSAALVLGLGIGVAAPLLGTTAALLPTVASAAVPGGDHPPASAVVPDWPRGSAAGTPLAASTGAHVVLRGDCLWDIAAGWLHQHQNATPTDAEVATAVHAWWTGNAAVIGPDPDLLLPGQVLIPPDPP